MKRSKVVRAKALFAGGVLLVGLVLAGVVTAADAGHTPVADARLASSKTATKATAAKPKSPITYKEPSKSLISYGQEIFSETCESCHGPEAKGTNDGPDLQGLGAGTIDFWVSTGRMPLAFPTEQAAIRPAILSHREQLAISAYIASLAPGGIAIPDVDLGDTNESQGEFMFSEDCAACHTITGSGDALSNNIYAPSLHAATPTEIAEAIRSGPGDMPRFGPGTLSNQQVADVVRYVVYLQHPDDRGGFGLGGVGAVAEGFVAIVIGLGSIMLAGYWIGGRAQ